MLRPFLLFRRALKDIWSEFGLMTLCSLLWCIFSLPLPALALLVLIDGAVLLAVPVLLAAVLPLAPATGALYAIAYRTIEGEATKRRDFFKQMRPHVVQGWLLTGTWMLGTIALVVSGTVYSTMANLVGLVLALLLRLLLVLWLALPLYGFALFQLHEAPTVRGVASTALLMVLGRPFYTLVVLLITGVLLVLSVWLPFLLLAFTPGCWQSGISI
ncbi:MAG: DUF624 domain-containing protein [Chloroflexaceae bacterium]|nr:DUF624 domain-containing protein [Chloroflexaceae bacterium]